MSEIRKLQVTCPCCDAQLTVEAATGEVLFVKQAEKKGLSFEDAVAQVKKKQETASERFDQAFAKERSRKEGQGCVLAATGADRSLQRLTTGNKDLLQLTSLL